MRAARLLCAGLGILALAPLAACGDEAGTAPPPFRELTREAIGYYCNMIVLDHPGPKAQIFLASKNDPLWFTSVRDAIAFTLSPEEPKDIAAIYVTDMSGAGSWDSPQPGGWIEARGAWFVIGSRRAGGMGTAEAVPFSERAGADRFAREYGGDVVTFDQVPRSYVLPGAALAPGAGP